jgi:hypothetical protein
MTRINFCYKLGDKSKLRLIKFFLDARKLELDHSTSILFNRIGENTALDFLEVKIVKQYAYPLIEEILNIIEDKKNV